MHKTRFAGLTELDPGDPLTVDGSSFSERNPSRTDYYLRIGAVTHRHDAHAQLQNPSVAPSASIVPSGGQIAANVTIFAAITLIDADGGETMRGLASQVATPAAPPPPSGAITAVFDSTGGSLPVGQYQYAITLNDPSGGETILGPTAFVQRQPGFPSGQVNLSGLANEIGGIYTSWNLWRAQDGGPFLLVQANGSANSLTDTGFACTDASRTPPVDMTGVRSTNTLFVTLPTAAQDPAVGSATSINLYLSLDGTFSDPSLYATYPVASAGQTIAASAITLLGGAPPAVNLASQGANQINPDTDILDWHWKRPVANQTALPSGSRGDVRMTLDTGHLWGVVTTASAMGSAGWTDLLADPETPVHFEASAAGGSASVGGLLGFVGAGGATVSVTDLGGGSAIVTVTAGGGGGGGGLGGVEVAASGGSGALGPEQYVEFAGSGGITTTTQSVGTGSARVLIGMKPLVPRGAYSSAAAYNVNDTVLFGGSAFTAEQAVPSGAASPLVYQRQFRDTFPTPSAADLQNYLLRKAAAGAWTNHLSTGVVPGTDIAYGSAGGWQNIPNSAVAMIYPGGNLAQTDGAAAVHYTNTSTSNDVDQGIGLYVDDDNYIAFHGFGQSGASSEQNFGWTGRVGGVALASSSFSTFTPMGSDFWLRLVKQGNTLTVGVYVGDPDTTAPLQAFTITLPSALQGKASYLPMVLLGTNFNPPPVAREFRFDAPVWGAVIGVPPVASADTSLLHWRGTFSGRSSYSVGDMVRASGRTLRANKATGAVPPTITASATRAVPGGSASMSIPASVNVGDLMFLFGTSTSNGTYVTPPGWTLYGQFDQGGGFFTDRLVVYTRVAQPGDPGGSVQVTCNSDDAMFHLRSYSTDGIDQQTRLGGSNSSLTPASLVPPAVGASSPADAEMVVFAMTNRNASIGVSMDRGNTTDQVSVIGPVSPSYFAGMVVETSPWPLVGGQMNGYVSDSSNTVSYQMLSFSLLPKSTPMDPSAWDVVDAGLEVAGSGGVGLTGFETYLEVVGSGGTSVGVQDMGGGSARVVIGPGDGGTATLVAGTVTVNDPSVTATMRIMLSAQDNNTSGALRVSARTPGTSFTITSSNAADSGLVAYQFFGT